ncbi:MAG TPA: YraN family protein [Anaerolineales bacterium]
MSTRRQTVGRWGEDAATAYLQAIGYGVLVGNVHFSHGESDIVASKDRLLVFVKVNTRTSLSYAYPGPSVTSREQAPMLSTLETKLDQHPESDDTWQFDMIAVVGKPSAKAEIEHFGNVIG